MSLKSRLDKLESTMTPIYRNPLSRVMDRHAGKRSFDRIMLLDTLAALLIKDESDHPKYKFAQDFLAWASTTDFRLIERAELILADLGINLPEPWEATAVDPGTVQPPYAWFCTQEQLRTFHEHPGWTKALAAHCQPKAQNTSSSDTTKG